MSKIILFIILGLIQGFTEPLPISSSGHLILAEHFLNIDLPGISFEIFVNFGSLIAILLFFNEDIVNLIKGFINYIIKRKEEDFKYFKYGLLIVVSTIPAAVIGLIFKDFIESNLMTVRTVGISLLVTALALYLISKVNSSLKKEEDINTVDAIIIGIAQSIALIPGISRSGATLVGAIARKIDIDDAIKYSFIMYIPISLATVILGTKDLLSDSQLNGYFGYYVAAFIASIFATYLGIKFLIRIVKTGNLKLFSLYCVIVGVLSIIFS